MSKAANPLDRVFYVYEHWRPDRNECFYVGKGHSRRAYTMANRNAFHRFIRAKLERLGLCVEVRIVEGGLIESEAFALERERVSLWRADGADLANMTDGGEGATGLRITPYMIQRIKETHIEKINSPETRAKISAANTGKKRTPEFCEKMRDMKSGRAMHPNTRAALLASHIGNSIKPSPETKKKLSDAAKKRAATPEGRAHLITAAATSAKKRKLEGLK